jgi:hypothetical protein
MKKNLIVHLIILLILLLSNLAFSQIPDWTWAKQAGGTESDDGYAIAVDNSGNSYITGTFRGTASFNGTSLSFAGGTRDIFVAKYNSSGDLLWAKQAGGTGPDYSYGIAVDGSSNSYVTGYFGGTAIFNGTSISSVGHNDIFIAKYDSDGNVLWAKRAGGIGRDEAYGIAVDGLGNSYVTGYFSLTASFNGTSLSSMGSSRDIFVAKCNTNGVFQWAKQAGGTGTDEGRGITVDGSRNSYATGFFVGTANFNGTSLSAPGTGQDIFVTKYDENGNFQWAKRAGGNTTFGDAGYGIAVDGSGNSYVTGMFYGAADFNGFTLNSAGSSDIFVAKYNTNGANQWAKKAGGSSVFIGDSGYGIAVDGLGNSYVTGYFEGFTGPASFSGTNIISAGFFDIFVAKYATNGVFQWVNQAGGGNMDIGWGIAIDGVGNSYVTGNFMSAATFGNTTLTAASDTDIFVAKLGTGDSDGDGIPDVDEDKDPKDRDGDGIDNKDDWDPTGWIYDESNGNIVSGGTISVTPMTGVTIIHNGSSGYFQFVGTNAGNYILSYTPPSGYLLSTSCTAQTGLFDAAPPPPNPYVLGLGSKNGTTNQMTNYVCADNPYYWVFHLEPGDQLVINNNIPLTPQQPTNVELSSFSADVEENRVIISWTTETELNNAGFNIFRSKQEESGFEKINESMIQAQGDATSGATYTFVDKPDEAGNFYYKLQDVSLDGATKFHGTIFLGLTSVAYKKYLIPKEYSLSQNFPNPFNPVTTIEFGLPNPSKVEITIYDIRGRLVRHLISEQRRAGYHWIKWDSRDDYGIKVSSGIYFYHITTTKFKQTKKMMMLK